MKKRLHEEEEVDIDADDSDGGLPPWEPVVRPAREEECEDEDAVDEEEKDASQSNYQPTRGDLTSIFFEELSAAQRHHGRANNNRSNNKRRRAPNAQDEYAAEEEEEDSDGEYGVKQRPALNIPKHIIQKFNPHGTAPPQSAEEYLLRVRLEADRCPRIKVAENIDASQYRGRQTAMIPPHIRAGGGSNGSSSSFPTVCSTSQQSSWLDELGFKFSLERQYLRSCGGRGNKINKGGGGKRMEEDMTMWLGTRETAELYAAAGETPPSSTSSSSSPLLPLCPSLPYLSSLPQGECRSRLQRMIELGTEAAKNSIERKKKKDSCDNEAHMLDEEILLDDEGAQGASSSPSAPPSSASSSSSSSSSFPSHPYCLWLYSLLLRVDHPLPASLSADVRSLARSLQHMIKELEKEQTDTSSKESINRARVIVAIAAKGFGQALI